MTHMKHVTMPETAGSAGHTLEFIKENLPTSLVELVELVMVHVKEFLPEEE